MQPKIIEIKSLKELPLNQSTYNYGAASLLVVQAKHAANGRGPVELVYKCGADMIVPITRPA